MSLLLTFGTAGAPDAAELAALLRKEAETDRAVVE
jgi:hypothetical protein